MIVVSTFGIERCTATRAERFAVQVLAERQLYTTDTAQYRFLAPFILWPDLDLMVSERHMAIFARVVDATALHLDRNDVGWTAIMLATGLRIEIDAPHVWTIRNHGQTGERGKSANCEQFFVESANLTGSIDKVNLQDPVALSAMGVGICGNLDYEASSGGRRPTNSL
jgi:hypothetical protein